MQDEEYEYDFDPEANGEEMEEGEYEDEFQPTEEGIFIIFYFFNWKTFNKISSNTLNVSEWTLRKIETICTLPWKD